MRRFNYLFAVLLVVSGLLKSCSAQTPPQQRISQFERAGFCDLLIDKKGIYHTVFQESPDNGKPTFIYYASSANKGVTWTKPITLSNDQTGNGAGYARILQDGQGNIYAIWKRFGNTKSNYPVGSELLDGPGGYSFGTLIYKVLSGGGWSQAVQLIPDERVQQSWFANVASDGTLRIFWSQLSPYGIKANASSWYYCDLLRVAAINGTTVSPIVDLSTPSKPAYAGGYPAEKEGAINLDGYVDKAGLVHLIHHEESKDIANIQYYNGQTQRVVYSYPKYQQGNTFNNPPRLLVDEKGNDHLIFVPSPSTLESEQIWDLNLATNQTNVLTSIQKKGIRISGFQADQGPNGEMAITFEAGGLSDNTEAYGIYYKNGVWKNVGLTNNASKEKFFTKDFIGLGGYRTNISTLTRYNSKFGKVAYDATGKKCMLMTIAAYWTAGGYSTSSPSIVFIPIDR